mmetsp:Transcript_15427/g.33550  ORF Transcript_15427/g.33550 Transcript_15427/m.33550 type:complete len:262 (-) Transcript_15427:589-1374(-)
MKGRTFGNCIIYKSLDDCDLTFHDHGPAVNIAIRAACLKRDALPKGPDLGKDGIDKLLLDGFINKQALNAAAILSTVLKATSHSPRNDIVDFDIVTENHGILTPQLENDRLKMLASTLHDPASDARTTSEDDFVNIFTGNKCGTSLTEASYGLNKVRIMTINLKCHTADTAKVRRTPRSVLRYLGHHSIATEDTRNNMIEHVMEGIVPRRDDTKNTKGDIFDVRSLVCHHGTYGTGGGFEPSLSVEVDAADLLACCHYLTE